MPGCRQLTDVEVIRVIKALTNTRDRCLFVVGLCTGLRITELLSLNVGDVIDSNPVPGHPFRVLNKISACVKGKRMRSVVLHQDAKDIIKIYLKESLPKRGSSILDPNQPLFISTKTNDSITRYTAYHILKDAYTVAGLRDERGRLATHCMRKTFAGRVYNALGKDVLKTGRALGHVEGFACRNTERYLDINQDEIDDAILKKPSSFSMPMN